MKAALVTLFLSLSSLAGELPTGGNLKITAVMLKFKYISFDGTHYIDCEHRIENAAAQDWRVTCRDDRGFARDYRVHLWVTLYSRDVEPRNSYEVLYWVTDFSVPGKSSGASSTIWFHLKDPSALHSLGLSQGVDQESAGLYLDLDPRKGTF